MQSDWLSKQLVYRLQLLIGFKGLNSIDQLSFAMMKCGVLFEVRTEYLNII
jgi:hypothetical protein